jgi:hypothetical protein
VRRKKADIQKEKRQLTLTLFDENVLMYTKNYPKCLINVFFTSDPNSMPTNADTMHIANIPYTGSSVDVELLLSMAQTTNDAEPETRKATKPRKQPINFMTFIF